MGNTLSYISEDPANEGPGINLKVLRDMFLPPPTPSQRERSPLLSASAQWSGDAPESSVLCSLQSATDERPRVRSHQSASESGRQCQTPSQWKLELLDGRLGPDDRTRSGT